MTTTKNLRVQMADPKRRVRDPVTMNYITGTAIVNVPNVSYWRRLIKEGALVDVDAPAKAPAKAEPVAVEAEAESAASAELAQLEAELAELEDTKD